MTDKHDFESFANQKLNETVEHMGHTTATRLAVMRHEAIASTTDRKQNCFMLAALASAMAAFMLTWMMPQQNNSKPDLPMQAGVIEDFDLLASDIELELLEDVEFYQWLESSKHAG